jgi:hypothetical protein
MIEISLVKNMYFIDFEPVDASNMFLLVYDQVAGAGVGGTVDPGIAAVTTGDHTFLLRTTNGGTSWDAVLFKTTVGGAGAGERLNFVQPSPAFATDNTVYVAERAAGAGTGTRIWKSTNGGNTWIGLTAPANITSFYAIDGSSYYTGAAGQFYKSGRFTTPALAGGATPNSIAIGKDNTIFIGTATGGVQKSVDDGRTFSPVGGGADMGGGVIWIAVDPDGTTLFAGSQGGGAPGVYRWTGSTVTWELLDTGVATAGAAVPAGAITATIAVLGDAFTVAPSLAGTVNVVATGTATVTAPGGVITVTAVAAGDGATITNISGAAASGQVTKTVGAGAVTFAAVAGSNVTTTPATLGGVGTFGVYGLGAATTGAAGMGLQPTTVMVAPDGTLYASNMIRAAASAAACLPSCPRL